jgi:gliding motility-associated-like protein
MAIFEDGSYSSSDKNCLLTKMQRPPDWINADYATINDRNRISLSFTFDHLSEISDFIFEKKTGDSGSFEIAGNYSSTTGNITFTDESADITRVNYYRLSAINGCKVPVTFSNIISNILPVITQAQDELSLVWNSPDRQAVFSYQGFINTGDGYGPFSSVLSDTVFSIRLKDIIYNVSGKDICFYIKASGLNNIHGINSDLKSSEVCVIPAETVTVPNVFTPDNDLVNDYFRPVLSFTPKDYYLMISDRNGRILFETHDYREEWNGEERGKIMPRDVYLWYLRVTAPSGRKITQTGTITIISTQ